jgi:TolA-binding protein
MLKKKLLLLSLLFIQISLFSQENSDDIFSNGRDAFASKSYNKAVEYFNNFLQTYPEDKRADGVNYMRSVSYFYLKQYINSINAFKFFETDYRTSAYNSRVSYWLGLCSYALKNFNDAADYFLKQTAFTSESFFVSRSYLYLGESYEKLNLTDKAIEAYLLGTKSAGEEKIISQSRLKLGLLYFKNNEYKPAKEQFLAILNSSIDSQLVSESQFYIGECQYYLGDLRDSASKLQFYLYMSSNNKHREAAIFRLGDIYQSLGMPNDAVRYLLLLKSDYPDGEFYLSGLRVLGTSYRSTNELDKAGAVFEEIIELTDDEIEKQNYYFELAQTKIDAGKPLESIALLKESSKGPDKNIEEISLYYLGELLLDNEREDEGASFLFELINRFPQGESSDDAALALSDYLVRTGDVHRLTLFVGSQLNRYGKYQDKFLLLKGELDENQGNYEEALLSYDRLIKEFPESDYVGNAFHKKSLLLIGEGKNREALPLLDQALSQSVKESDRTDILVDKAIVLYTLGEMEEADAAFKILLEKDMDFPRMNEILFRQGELSLGNREYADAAEYFRRAAETSTGDKSISALFNMGKSYFYGLNFKTSERIYSDLSEKLSSTSGEKTEAMKMTALSIFLQQDWTRTLQYSDLLVTSLGVYPSEIRVLKMLSLLALGRSESLKKEIADLNRNEKENKLLADTFNQLMKIDADSVLLIFRSLLTAYPQESSQQLLGLLLTDMFYITSDDDWIKETFTLINPQLDDEVLLIAFKQAYDMNINE